MLEAETRQVDQAADAFAAASRRLYRPDGVTPIYSGPEHTERLDALTAALDDVLGQADEAANTASHSASAVLDDETDHRVTAMDRLSEADLARANTRRPFVEEDAKHLHQRELAHRARQALESGDRALAFLLARYGGLRVEAEAAAGRGVTSDTLGLKAAVDALWDTFKDPKAPQQRQAAQETRKAASALRRRIREKRVEVTGRDPEMEAARRRVGVGF